MLATGNVDALIYWSTSAPPLEQPLAEMHKSMKIIPWSEFGFDGYGYVLLASDKMIKNRPEDVRKFVQAYREAQAIAIADPKAAAEVRQGRRTTDRCSAGAKTMGNGCSADHQ